MSKEETGILERLVAASLEKCFLRISGVSGAAWRLTGVNISRGGLPETVNRHDFKNPDAYAVYIHVESGLPFTSLMLFDTDDVPRISKCFLGESLQEAAGIPQFNEVMLLELGNIVLNAIINQLQNALKKSAIPSVPMLLKGSPDEIAGALGVYLEPRQSFLVVTASLTVQCGPLADTGEVLAIIPEALAAALERA